MTQAGGACVLRFMTRRELLTLLLFGLCDCRRNPPSRFGGRTRTPSADGASVNHVAAGGDIDWNESAGIFIGIQNFRPSHDAPREVLYAADDAADLAYLLTDPRAGLLPRSRAALLLAGTPSKPRSREHLDELRRDMTVIVDGVDGGADVQTIYDLVGRGAAKAGPRGVVVLSISSHGYSDGGQQIVLTADSPAIDPIGVTIAGILHALRSTDARLVLFIDACRRQFRTGTDESRTAMSAPFFEELQSRSGYVVLSASAPGGYAESSDTLQNGLFTCAVLEGLSCRAPVTRDLFVTAATLNTYVAQRVRALSEGRQQTEGRYGGGLEGLRLVSCNVPPLVGRILYPETGSAVGRQGKVEFVLDVDGLYATVLVCAGKNRVCYNQNDRCSPILMRAGRAKRVPVTYGDGVADEFSIYVAATADGDFLHNVSDFSGDPQQRTAQEYVHWLGPVNVVNSKEVQQ